MNEDSLHTASKEMWEHVHQCPQCEQIVRADDIPRPAIISGVMTCPKCEFSGPIKVPIVSDRSYPRNRVHDVHK